MYAYLVYTHTLLFIAYISMTVIKVYSKIINYILNLKQM